MSGSSLSKLFRVDRAKPSLNDFIADRSFRSLYHKPAINEQLQMPSLGVSMIEDANDLSALSLKSLHKREFKFKDRDPFYWKMLGRKFLSLIASTPKTSRIMFGLDIEDEGGTVYRIYRRLNDENLPFFSDLFRHQGIYDEQISNIPGSDVDYISDRMKVNSITVFDVDKLDLKNKHGRGGYGWRWLLIDDTFDLSRLQIYAREEDIDPTPCFIYALKQSHEVNEATIQSIAQDLKGIDYVRLSTIEHIAKKYNLNIHVTYYYEHSANKYLKYGTQSIKPINLIIMYNHIMINEPIACNYNWYRYMNDADSTLVQKKGIEGWRYHATVPIKKVVDLIPLLFKNGAFKPRTFYAAEVYDRSGPSYDINPSDLKPYDAYGIHGLYSIGGKLQSDISKCVRGGRVYCSKKQLIDEPIMDFDIHALYPYSMSKMALPLGKPIEVKPSPIYLREVHGSSFIDVEIRSVNTWRSIPVLKELVNEDSLPLRTWMTGIDLICLIRWQGVGGWIYGGYWFQDSTVALQPIIKDMYKRRLEGDDNAKLEMNKIYGNFLRKARPLKRIEIKREDLYKYLAMNFNQISKIQDDGASDMVSVDVYKRYTDHYNMCHCGALVAAYSRFVMNQTLYVLEDAGIEVLYHDTDSIFIRKSDYDKHKDLILPIGDGLGEWHEDNKNITSGIFISKKKYCLKLADGSAIFRCAGVNKSSIINPWAYMSSML